MPTAVTASSRRARHIVTRIGMNGMYSSAIPTVEEPRAKSATIPATSHSGRVDRRRIAAAIAPSKAPVARTTLMTPPTRKTKKMISCAAPRPAGMDVRKARGGSGGGVDRAIAPLDDPPAVALELAGGNHVARRLGQDDQREDEDERVGETAGGGAGRRAVIAWARAKPSARRVLGDPHRGSLPKFSPRSRP